MYYSNVMVIENFKFEKCTFRTFGFRRKISSIGGFMRVDPERGAYVRNIGFAMNGISTAKSRRLKTVADSPGAGFWSADYLVGASRRSCLLRLTMVKKTGENRNIHAIKQRVFGQFRY